MKKILIVFSGLQITLDEGAKHRLNSFIIEYANLNYEVTVLAFVKTGLLLRNKKTFLNNKAKWILLPYLPISKNLLLSKIFYFYTQSVLVFLSWLKRYDLIQIEQTAVLKHSLCYPHSFYITDIHGDGYWEYIEMVHNHKIWYAKQLLNRQLKIILNSDFCICVSENLKQQLEQNTGQDIKNFGIISCAVDYNRFVQGEPLLDLSEKLNSRIILGYSGGLQKWQNIELIIETAIRLYQVDKRFFLLIYTNHSIIPYQLLLNKLGKENYMIKALSSHEIPPNLKLFDVGFLFRSNWILNSVSSPTKICEYLAAGVPVICTQYSGDYKRSVFHKKTGFVLKDVSISNEEIDNLIQWLIDVKQNRMEYVTNCQAEAKKRIFSKEFIQTLRKFDI